MRYYTLRKASYPNTATSSRDFLALRPTRVTIESFIEHRAFFSPFRSLKLHLKLWEALLYFAGLNSFKKGFSSRFSLYRPPNGQRIRATVKILRLHFLQTLCCFKRKRIRIIKPPSWTIHHTSTLPSKRSVLLGNESILRATSTACWLLDTDRMVSVI